jgi:hypothetical protein
MGDCSFPGCGHDTMSGELCEGHRKQRQRGQSLSPLAHRPSNALERLTEAAIAYAEADEDEDFARARDNLRKAAGVYGRRHVGERIRERLAELRAAGVRLGRPPLVDKAVVQHLAKEVGVGKAALLLGVSRVTVWRVVRRSGT